ncbi:MAG TPA: 2-amino-4-hydroxy-6-hydroxymethyldihydropteridine diphosphokinase [Saprospiraceae bacterium]|nr:2-amino-4-hydroxy-6-hydroxymethyldihydropteridine diphosphokinase [Saprospiraceae bacterium]HMQ84366.1 2-amino-4-hydroxy-6-hydroxymethyldihydropteridine diphosphokinase [Saprospiraceae bacterium]
MNTLYLHTGSNLGDKMANLSAAYGLIGQTIGAIIRSSSLYVTAPWGITDQPDFFNQALEVETSMSPHEVLSQIHDIESLLGRKRVIKWGSRVIDIDILFYNDWIITESELTIPHPFLHERNFVLIPLLEIAPNLVHPLLGLSIQQLAAQANDPLNVKAIFQPL